MVTIKKEDLLNSFGQMRSNIVKELEKADLALAQIDFIIECLTTKKD